MRKKTSIIWTISKEDLQSFVDSSDSIHSILPKLGLSRNSAGSFIQLKKRLKEDSIDISSLNERAKEKRIIGIKKYSQGIKIPLKEILKENSNYCRSHLKKRLVEDGLKEYKCDGCGNCGEWGGKPLNLQLEHKNGINNDNRLENLCFLCPNCHSQTDTFGSRNKPKKDNHCKKCGCLIGKKSKICKKCRNKSMTEQRRLHVSKEELCKLIQCHSWTKIGEMFGVSDKAVKKLAVKYNIDISIKFPGCESIKNSLIHKLTKDELKKELENLSLTKISKKYKCSLKTINSLIVMHSIEYKPNRIERLNDDEKSTIADMYNSKTSLSEISRIVKRDRNCIRNFIKTNM
jgi:Mor family transcriptional regulator